MDSQDRRKSKPSRRAGQDALTPARVKAYLRENPSVLQDDLDLLAECMPGRKPDATIVDLQQSLIARQREALRLASAQAAEAEPLHNNGLAALTGQAHEAALHLLDAPDLESAIAVMTRLWPEVLGLSAVAICVEAAKADGGVSPLPSTHIHGVFVLSPGDVAAKFVDGAEAATFRHVEPDARIYGAPLPPVHSELLVRLHISTLTPDALIAFGAAEPEAFEAEADARVFLFLARLAERRVRAVLDLPPPATPA